MSVPTSTIVVLVHPHDDNREMYAEFLRHHGLSVLPCADADGGLAVAAQADVIVTGVRLAGPRDGVELIGQLRHDGRTTNTPVIVLTACVLPKDRARVERAGCAGFLPMPCLPEELLHAIQRLKLRGIQAKPAMLKATISADRQLTTGNPTSEPARVLEAAGCRTRSRPRRA